VRSPLEDLGGANKLMSSGQQGLEQDSNLMSTLCRRRGGADPARAMEVVGAEGGLAVTRAKTPARVETAHSMIHCKPAPAAAWVEGGVHAAAARTQAAGAGGGSRGGRREREAVIPHCFSPRHIHPECIVLVLPQEDG